MERHIEQRGGLGINATITSHSLTSFSKSSPQTHLMPPPRTPCALSLTTGPHSGSLFLARFHAVSSILWPPSPCPLLFRPLWSNLASRWLAAIPSSTLHAPPWPLLFCFPSLYPWLLLIPYPSLCHFAFFNGSRPFCLPSLAWVLLP